MKTPMQKHPTSPVERPRLTISSEQLARLMDGVPEKYRDLIRVAIEKKTPLSASGLSDAERVKAIRAFKKAREAAALPDMIFHDLTRATILKTAA